MLCSRLACVFYHLIHRIVDSTRRLPDVEW
jgi:hypothetical protein